jgi:hypothetical protein
MDCGMCDNCIERSRVYAEEMEKKNEEAMHWKLLLLRRALLIF